MYCTLVWVILIVAVFSRSAFAQVEPSFTVLQPEYGKVFAWSRTRPDIRIEVQTPIKHRPFVTASIYDTVGTVVDRVSLYDDGSHGDSQPSDGIFTGTYSPQATGDYVLKVRLQWTDPISGAIREQWTEPRSFAVEQVPYPRIISPTPGQRVGSRVKVGVRMLVGEEMKPYEPQGDEIIRVRAWGEPSVEARVPDRARGEFTATLQLPRPGSYRLFVTTAVQRRGQWIEAEAESVQVQYTRPTTLPFWIGSILLLLGLFLPGKAVTIYRHDLRFRHADGTTYQTQVSPNLLNPVRKTVGGKGCDVQLPDVEGTLFTLLSCPGNKSLQVEPGEVTDLPKEIRPTQNEAVLRFKDWALEYKNAQIVNFIREPWFKFTPIKWAILAAGVILLLYGGWLFWQFQQLLTS